ncbi:small GTP-binding protein [Histomonas meleagridis]|uniref:small GTP-binding protein n=1 Tax=Histomonas meleagridis TaxID=135588 RepID=UPI00355A596B|nr:small GTP-binding protein [Histomonas meleagridis]KAH0798954.1 small GTP-binding protein [Histomonas meleagridis]
MTVPTFKFLLIGNTSVGKTSLINRLCEDTFVDNKTPTIGVDYQTKVLNIRNTDVVLQIWDTAGQEKYRSITRPYYRDAVGVLIVFSITDHESFEAIGKWIADAQELCDKNVKILLIGNKIDLVAERKVTTQEAQDYATTVGLKYIESSAQNNTNVEEAFQMVARDVYDAYASGKFTTQPKPFEIEDEEGKKSSQKGSCC